MGAPDIQSAGIFLSYRREDASAQAGRLYDRLSERFGEGRVFMDVDSVDLGADFVDELERAVDSCAVMLVLIGRNWLDAQTVEGSRKIDRSTDYVRIEVARALNRGIRVVPVLVDGAPLPGAEVLPEALRPLARRQAMELRHATFRPDMNRLLDGLAPITPRDAVTPASGRSASSDAVAPETHQVAGQWGNRVLRAVMKGVKAALRAMRRFLVGPGKA